MYCLDVERKSIFSVLQQSYIPVAIQNKVKPSVLVTVTTDKDEPAVQQDGDIDTFEGDKLREILQRSAIKSDLLSSDEEDESSDAEQSLLIPVLALSAIAVLTLSLAAFRLFYTRFYKDKEDPHPR